MSWPIFTDYQTAVQNPHLCFFDKELKLGKPDLNKLGLPITNSGNFAVVFPLQCGVKKWAVRCFSKQQPDREFRYNVTSQYLSKLKIPYLVDFSFLNQGIKLNSKSFPIIKMEWVNGEVLDKYIERNLHDPNALKNLTDTFVDMVHSLQKNNIAHGDLQHRNILISNDQLRLVDYDGMFVPGLEQLTCCEGGHPNYQSSMRTDKDFSIYLDNFSAWLIYLSLVAITISPDIWNLYRGDDEALILTRDDLLNPELSPKFQFIETINNSHLNQVASAFRSFTRLNLKNIPPLDTTRIPIIQVVQSETNIPDWLKDRVSESPVLGEPWKDKLLIPELSMNQFTNENINLDWIHQKSTSTKKLTVFKKPYVERISLVVALLSLVSLIMWGIVESKSLMLTIPISLFIVSLWLVFIVQKFKALPELKVKNKIRSEFGKLKVELDVYNQRSEELKQCVKKIIETENNQFKLTLFKFDMASELAKAEVKTLDDELKKKLDNIKKESQNLNDNISQEISRALKNLQATQLNFYLSKIMIKDATIPGVGVSLKNALITSGIRTAADFSDVKKSTTYYYNNPGEVVYILLNNGNNIRIPLIGPKKGATILAWKKSIELKYKNNLPISLPNSIEQAIRSKASEKHKLLKVTESQLKQVSGLKKKEIIKTCIDSHDQIRKQISIIRTHTMSELQDISGKIKMNDTNKRELNDNIESRKNDLNEYQKVNFGKYVKRIIQLIG